MTWAEEVHSLRGYTERWLKKKCHLAQEDAEDVVSEAVLICLVKFPDEGTGAKTWLTHIALNVALTRYKAVRVRTKHFSKHSQDCAEKRVFVPDESLIDLLGVIGKMPRDLRKTVRMLYAGYTVDEVAETLGTTNSKLSKRILRWRQENSPYKKFVNKYPGVCLYRKRNRWKATATVDGKLRHIGYFDTAQDAHWARVTFLREHGAKGPPNPKPVVQ